MPLRDRLLAVLALVAFIAAAALLLSFFLLVGAVLVVVGGIVALAFYIRVRFAMRRYRRSLQQASADAALRPQQPPGPASNGETIDADFRVDNE